MYFATHHFCFVLSVYSGSRRKLSSLAIYTEEDSKFDMSDLTPVVSDVNDSSDKMETNVSKLFLLLSVSFFVFSFTILL
jgi:hypothetical protein